MNLAKLLALLAWPVAAQVYVINAVGTEEAPPDQFHVMMKMEYAAARSADAIPLGEKRLREFLAAVDALQLPRLTWRVTNFVLGEPEYGQVGITYTRNVVFTAPDTADRDRVIARLEDVGARYNSHCVTCIGSG